MSHHFLCTDPPLWHQINGCGVLHARNHSKTQSFQTFNLWRLSFGKIASQRNLLWSHLLLHGKPVNHISCSTNAAQPLDTARCLKGGIHVSRGNSICRWHMVHNYAIVSLRKRPHNVGIAEAASEVGFFGDKGMHRKDRTAVSSHADKRECASMR